MLTLQCHTEGCVEKVHALGWCQRCYYREYQRARRDGSAWLDGRRARGQSLFDRALSRIDDLGGLEACWPWTGTLDRHGYGQIMVQRENGSWIAQRAHRVVYFFLVGSEERQFDHVCHTRDSTCPGGVACMHRRCVNPAHLEPVTHRENRSRQRERSMHCKYGHEWTEENTLWQNGARWCRACTKRRSLARRKPDVGPATHCPNGHEYTEENTGVYRGNKSRGSGEARRCKVCQGERQRRYRASQRMQ